MLKSALLCVAVAIGLTSSCATTGQLHIPRLEQVSPEELQQKISGNFQRLFSFEGRARVSIELPGQGYNGSARVLVRTPDSVYVKTEAILGIDVGALFLDHRYFAAYAPRENTLYYGEAGSLRLRDFLQIEIERDELVGVFTGLTQLVVGVDPVLSEDDGQFLLTMPGPDGQVKTWIDPARNVVTRSEVTDSTGEIILKKEFQRFKKKSGVFVPQLIRITRPQARERLTVLYTRQKLNENIDSEEFQVKTARDAKRIYWSGAKRKLERESSLNKSGEAGE